MAPHPPKGAANEHGSDQSRGQGSNLKLEPLQFVPAMHNQIKDPEPALNHVESGRHRLLSPLPGGHHLPSMQEVETRNILEFDHTAKPNTLEPLRKSHPSKSSKSARDGHVPGQITADSERKAHRVLSPLQNVPATDHRVLEHQAHERGSEANPGRHQILSPLDREKHVAKEMKDKPPGKKRKSASERKDAG
eukprot:TRINITY_DN9292_c0_g2_i1.p1 TRINITY_DN9292_c0_g2~~TRINITY_DN9292_c0_g2_i1.p1  ORF type:complete len:192 (+),score=32.98 TRINITY_DN9292_c0_g2_i1:84-659(+)